MKATTIGRWWWAVALAALFAATSGARADEPPEDAASLLRRGKVAESVEHDVPKAMDLYKKALDAGGSSDAARDAALRLADLLEVRGKRSDALDLLRTVTERLTSRLDEEQKRRVHEAMARLLPAGSHARSPLGDVYVLPAPGSVAVSAASPLDAKILALLARLDDVDPQQRNNVENQIRQALDVVGKDALPTLERAMNSERLDKAQFAAREYARIGKADALPGLERTLREGDGFARGAAVQALLSLQKGDDVSPALVLVLDRIFDLPTLADRRQALLWTLTNHLSEEELLRRQAAGGADADAYLLAAVQRNSAPGIERAIALARGSATLPKGLLESLLAVAGATQSGWSNNRPIWTMKIPTLDPALRREILRLVLAQPLTPESVKAVAGIAAAVQATVPEAEGRQVAHDAWVWALAGKGNVEACRALLQAYVSPPASVFDSAPAGASYGATLASLFQSMRGTNGAQTLLQRDLAASPGFWGVLLDALGALDSTMRSDVLGSVPSADMALIPADLGPRWVALARLPSTQGYPQIVYWSAARGGGADDRAARPTVACGE